MKKWLGFAVGVAGMVGTVWTALPPAHAAATYTIYGSAPFAVTKTAFTARNCDPNLAKAITSGGLSGVDAVIVDVSAKAGGPMTVSWGTTSTPANNSSSQLPASLTASFLDGNCQPLGASDPKSVNPGPWSLQVPLHTKWLVISAQYAGNTTVTI